MADSARMNAIKCQPCHFSIALTSSGEQVAGVRSQSRCCGYGQ